MCLEKQPVPLGHKREFSPRVSLHCPVPLEINNRLEQLKWESGNDKSVLLNQILEHFFDHVYPTLQQK